MRSFLRLCVFQMPEKRRNGKGNLKKDYLDNASSGYQTYRKELAEEAYTERGKSNMWGATLLPSDTTGVVLSNYSESTKSVR